MTQEQRLPGGTDVETVVVIDTETTGKDPREGAALLEVALVCLEKLGPLVQTEPGDPEYEWHFGHAASYMVAHEGPIPPEARGVHHIAPEDVAPGAPDVFRREDVVASMLQAAEPLTYYAAHNAEFDRQFLEELGGAYWICTWRCARHLWPEAPDHKNQTLRYFLGVEPPATLLAGLAPHRALYDAAVTAAILQRMLRDHSPEKLVELTRTPVLYESTRLRGEITRFEDMDFGALRWFRDKNDRYRTDPDFKHTVDHHIAKRLAR